MKPNSKAKQKQGKRSAPTPPQRSPQRVTWVKKSHLKRNLAIVLSVIILVGLGVYSVSQQPAAGQVFQAASSDWKTAQLTDARTSQTFTLSQFSGKVVVLELMATWCGNCRQQGFELQKVVQQLGGNSQVVIVTVDVDPNENVAKLQAYANQNNFGSLTSTPQWYYAADTSGRGQLLRAIVGTSDPATFVQTFVTLTPTYIIPKEQGNTFSLLEHSSLSYYNPASDVIAAIDKALKA